MNAPYAANFDAAIKRETGMEIRYENEISENEI
jgi:hypothetical protein